MVSSLLIACYLNFGEVGLEDWEKIIVGSILTTIIWVIATFLTPPDDDETLQKFVIKVNPEDQDGQNILRIFPQSRGLFQKVFYLCYLGVFLCTLCLLELVNVYGHIELGVSVLVLGMISLFGLLKLWK